jgi:FeS assembly SUF system regulator
MIRIAKLTDYAIVLLAHMARNTEQTVHATRDLAASSGLPMPTVRKVLKALSRGGLVVSQRGAQGGYGLAKAPRSISITAIIGAMEGPVALTECSTDCQGACEIERACPVRSNWQTINELVRRSLANITLADMAIPLPKPVLGPAQGGGKRVQLRLMAQR